MVSTTGSIRATSWRLATLARRGQAFEFMGSCGMARIEYGAPSHPASGKDMHLHGPDVRTYYWRYVHPALRRTGS